MATNNYFREKTDKEKTDANTEMRKGHYNGEMYHSLQDSTHRLMVRKYFDIVPDVWIWQLRTITTGIYIIEVCP